MVKQQTIFGRHFVTNKPIAVHIDGSVIDRVEYLEPDKSVPDIIIAPGLIDLQVNGYDALDFSTLDLTAERVVELTQKLWQKGITTFLPTIITSAPDIYHHSLTIFREVITHSEIRGTIPCIHMEGPYLSSVDGYRGAHPLKWIKSPDWQEFQKYNLISGNHISLVTVAPELPGAIEFISKCSENGIKVAIGHHAADKKKIDLAVKNGAVLSTHLGNACANLISRHDNVLWPQLAHDGLHASLILDRFHLNREEVIVFARSKGMDKIILISDMTRFAGVPPGIYDWQGTKITVSADGKVHQADQQILAGASKVLTEGISNLIEFTGCAIGEAINTATINPAKLMQFDDRGELVSGKRADIIIFRVSNGEMEIIRTMVGGEIVYER
jgi:N-acetylglucosamine-6-phosphate deacetylase